MTVEPEPQVRVAVERFPATIAAVPAIRAETVRHLRGWGLNPQTIESAELVTAELTSNAVKITDSVGSVVLRLTCLGATLTIEVWDSCPAPPVRVEPTADDESGRGLLLVDALSQRWSWYYPRNGGKVIWAQIRTEPPLPHIVHADSTMLPRRSPVTGPAAGRPVAFAGDLTLLQRVIDGLRGLDNWPPYPDDADPNRRGDRAYRTVPHR